MIFSRFQALAGNALEEALPLIFAFENRGGASGYALPGRAWKREETILQSKI
jgi:hypothetical protein